MIMTAHESLSLNNHISQPRICAIANQKGGVGKTTTAINLGTALAAIGRHVLIIDLDPQGNAATGLGISRSERKKTSYDVLLGQTSLSDAMIPTSLPGLHIVPANRELAGAGIELVHQPRREHRLTDAITTLTTATDPQLDHILIDCPPALNLLTVNALTAADGVIVPLQVEFLPLEGLDHLLGSVARARRTFNPRLAIDGIVLTMFDRRNALSDSVALDVRQHLGDKVYRTVIPRNVRVSEAPSHGLPVLVYDHRCAGSVAYMQLAREMLKQEVRS